MPDQAPAQAAVGVSRYPLLQVRSNADITRIEEAERARQRAEQLQHKPQILSLASHVRTAWQDARLGKMEVEQRLLKCLRQRNGEYDPDLKIKIQKHGGSDIYMMITAMKCRAAEAWIKDVELPAGEKPWGVDPTPYPDLPGNIEDQIEELVMFEAMQVMAVNGVESVTVEQVRDRIQELRDEVFKEHMEIARETCARFETRIEDELREGKFYNAFEMFISDLVTFPTAFLKGPILRMRKALRWDFDQDGMPIPRVKSVLRREYDCVSPFDIYPSKGAKDLNDGYLCERIRMRPSYLEALKGVPGYDSAAIDGVLWEYGRGGLKDWLWTDQERDELESKPHAQTDIVPLIDGVLFWGEVQGRLLREWGMSVKQVPKLLHNYQVCVMLIGNWVVMARLNPHPLGRRNYYSASYERVNNSIWGKCVPELMADIQRMCNAAARSLVNNMGIASGPQVEVHTDRLQPGEDAEDIYPWKVWKTKRDEQGQRDSQALYWYSPDSHADELLKVYTYWFDHASEVTGIPSYFQGSQMNVRGAGKTASGLSMLLNAASKTLKSVIFNIDGGVTVPVIDEHWLQLMLYDEDLEKTGDINIVARASEYLLLQEQLQVRLQEFLNFTNNDIDLSIMGLGGRAELLREAVKFLKVPRADKIIPPEEAFMQAEQQAEETGQDLMAMQGGAAGPVNPARTTALTPAGQPAGGMTTQHMPQIPVRMTAHA